MILDHRGNPIVLKQAEPEPAAPGIPVRVRRWESAETTRLNSAHWAKAQAAPINSDLSLDWSTLVTRCTYEAENNPLLEGVIETHVADVVGPNGPTLEVQSDSGPFNDWFEEHWADWWAMPDVEGGLPGPEMMDLWVRMLWKTGEYLIQLTNDPEAEGVVQARWKNIHPRYLQTPLNQTANPRIILGVERSALGKPVRYWIVDEQDVAHLSSFAGQPEPVDAEFIIHDFKRKETGQGRGVPWGASCLQVIADLRDGDNQILDAVRMAADFGIAMQAKSAEAMPITPGTTATWQRRQLNTLPAGWEAVQIRPEQPKDSYLEFRKERMRELGRPVGMPLMKVRLSSEKHNFSQAKFDAGNYWRMVEKLQRWIERRALNRMARLVEREARLAEMIAGASVPAPPRRYQLVWTWPGAPKVDPRIEAIATQIMRALGGATMQEVLAPSGKTVEQHVAQLERERAIYAAADVPYPEIESVVEAVAASAAVDAEEAAAEAVAAGASDE